MKQPDHISRAYRQFTGRNRSSMSVRFGPLRRHALGRPGIAAHPRHRNDRRILHDRRTQGKCLALQRTIGLVAEADVDRPVFDPHRSNEIADDAIGVGKLAAALSAGMVRVVPR